MSSRCAGGTSRFMSSASAQPSVQQQSQRCTFTWSVSVQPSRRSPASKAITCFDVVSFSSAISAFKKFNERRTLFVVMWSASVQPFHHARHATSKCHYWL
eukprot:12425613-Karenia_brevis.AAC.1